ncbi:MaoC/PaaZ C-terminal domain-containing protein [Georgenia halophila]|uniref:MaoC/PaaZ C-terminal domain-containing protein n=1 Tax=Georgenia halophila TaxID=620889 RepID=A0ABP8KY35_9MICO
MTHRRPGHGPPAGYREELLPTMPSLGKLYATAMARTGRLVLAKPVAHDLPKVALRVDGVRADAAGLSDYQHLVGEPGTDELPAGYVHVLAFPLAMAVMVREDFPLPVLGMVHVANRVEQHHRLDLDETVTVRAWAQEAREHARGVTVDLVTEVTYDGTLAWRGASTYLAKGRPPKGLPLRPATERPERADRAERPQPPSEPTAVWRLSGVAARYAEVSGDRNPIHVSRLGARLFGFKRPIAHGMYTASRALAGTPAALRRRPFVWTVDFAKPVLLPATVEYACDPSGQHAVWSRRSKSVHLTGRVEAL